MKMRTLLTAVLAVSLIAFGAALFADPARAWGGWLAGAWLTLALGLSGALLVAMLYMSGAGWGVIVRRVPEQMGMLIPLGALLLILTLVGAHSLYPWSRPEVIAADPLVAGKTAYLNVLFMLLRGILFLGLWSWLARRLAVTSLEQDASPGLALTRRNRMYSAAMLVSFAVGMSMLSVDWLLSLQPEFYSTIFMLYVFCGIMLTGLSAATIVTILLHRRGALPGLRPDHLQDMGKLILMFSTLWAYMWLSQYLLIWYTNIPEEIVFYVARKRGIWAMLWVVNLFLNWVIPFLILLPREAKRSETVLLIVCSIVLAGQFVDVLHLVAPVVQSVPTVGWIELLVPLAGPAAFLLLLSGRLAGTPNVPVGDPLLSESLHHHQ